jgi:hypothetical protein
MDVRGVVKSISKQIEMYFLKLKLSVDEFFNTSCPNSHILDQGLFHGKVFS